LIATAIGLPIIFTGLKERDNHVRPLSDNGFVSAIGNTPLIRLKSIEKITGCRILAKAEHMNPGGSVKDRPALHMVEDLEKEGKINKNNKNILFEGTGGNTGVGLALVARAKGYECVLVVPDHIAKEKIELMKLFGAKVKIQPTVPFSDPNHYYHIASDLANKTKGGIFLNQFENKSNFMCHYSTTAPEIWKQANGVVDGVCISAGTGGTIAGISKFLKEKNPNSRVFLIDPFGSGLYSFIKDGVFKSEGATIAEGIGIMRKTANFASAQIDGAFRGTDREIVEMAHYLLRNEGIFVGPSSALNVVGAVKLAKLIGPNKTIVTVLCDSGDRYRTKLYNEEYI